MSLRHIRRGILRPVPSGSTYNVIPIRIKTAIPANFYVPIHGAYFDNATHLNAIFSNMQAAGEDLRIFGTFSGGVLSNERAIEIQTVNNGSTVLCGHFKTPIALAVNDYVYARTTIAGGENAYAATDPFGRNAVWSDCELVVHGGDIGVDATGNNANATITGTAAKSGVDLQNEWPARGFGAREGVASTDRVIFSGPAYAEVCSQSIFFYKEGTEDHVQGRLLQWEGINNSINKRVTDGVLLFRDCSTDDQRLVDGPQGGGGTVADDAWHGLGVAWPAPGTGMVHRFNRGLFNAGYLDFAGAGSVVMPASGLVIGNITDGTIPLDGRISEIRHRLDNVPDAAWFDLEQLGYSDPGAIAEAEAMVQI